MSEPESAAARAWNAAPFALMAAGGALFIVLTVVFGVNVRLALGVIVLLAGGVVLFAYYVPMSPDAKASAAFHRNMAELERLEKKNVDELLGLTSSPDARVREAAAQTLGGRAEGAPPLQLGAVGSTLLGMLGDPSPRVVAAAAYALSDVEPSLEGGARSSTVDRLYALALEPGTAEEARAGEAGAAGLMLRHLTAPGPYFERAFAFSTDASAAVREEAVSGLASIFLVVPKGEPRRQALEHLRRAAADPAPDVRGALPGALHDAWGSMDPEQRAAATELLNQLKGDADDYTRCEAAEALERLKAEGTGRS